MPYCQVVISNMNNWSLQLFWYWIKILSRPCSGKGPLKTAQSCLLISTTYCYCDGTVCECRGEVYCTGTLEVPLILHPEQNLTFGTITGSWYRLIFITSVTFIGAVRVEQEEKDFPYHLQLSMKALYQVISQESVVLTASSVEVEYPDLCRSGASVLQRLSLSFYLFVYLFTLIR